MLPNRILFDDFLEDFKYDRTLRSMPCDVYEENNEYHIVVDVPGFNKENITIECDKGNIKIIAQKNEENVENKNYLHHERKFYQKFERSFYLGNVNEDEISASFKDGILKIIVPKEEEKSSKKTISIN